MDTGNIEFVQGRESHTSNWGKFYVKGLEPWAVREDFPEDRNDRHHQYSGRVCPDVPQGTWFTIFEQNGNKRGTDTFVFSICRVTAEKIETYNAEYGSGKILGNYEVVVQATGKTKAPRLMGWWQSRPQGRDAQWAIYCANHINKRGCKDLPPLEDIESPRLTPEEIQCITAAIERGCRDEILKLSEAQ